MEANTSRMITLNGSNYQSWKIRMEDFLYVNELHQPLICLQIPDGKTDDEWNLLHRRVCGYIRQWVDESVLKHVSGDINAHTLWSKLEKLYASNTCDGKLCLVKQLMSLRYCDGTAMSDHLNSFEEIINRLTEMGIKIDDEVQGLWLLGTLPDTWGTVRASILNATPGGVISMELAKHSILNAEMRRKSQGPTLYPYASSVAASRLYTTLKVARDEDLRQQIGNDVFFDLVDHNKVLSFRIQKQTPFAWFKDEVSRRFGISVHCQRFWLWAKRQNLTYRPYRPLTPLEEAQPVGQLRETSSKTNNFELKLFLEVEIGQDSWPVPPPAKTKNKIMLFFKLYDPSKEELRYVGRLWVEHTGKPKDMLTRINKLAGFAPSQEIELFEEVKFQPIVMCEPVNKALPFNASLIEDGDIICFQKLLQAGTETYRYPDVPSFLEHVHNRQNRDV